MIIVKTDFLIKDKIFRFEYSQIGAYIRFGLIMYIRSDVFYIIINLPIISVPDSTFVSII